MSSIKRFSNKVQLIRHIHDETGVPVAELWERYEVQYDN